MKTLLNGYDSFESFWTQKMIFRRSMETSSSGENPKSAEVERAKEDFKVEREELAFSFHAPPNIPVSDFVREAPPPLNEEKKTEKGNEKRYEGEKDDESQTPYKGPDIPKINPSPY